MFAATERYLVEVCDVCGTEGVCLCVWQGVSDGAVKLLPYILTEHDSKLDTHSDVVDRLLGILDVAVQDKSNDNILMIVQVRYHLHFSL